MKKVLLLIISAMFAIQANAQTQEEAPAVTIDSLSTKLVKLQHNYDFLYCDYQLYQIKTGLEQLSQNIKIDASIISMHHGWYDRDLYTRCSDIYDSYCDTYDGYKRFFETVQRTVTIKIATTGFTEFELNVFNSCIKTIESCMEVVETSLRYYDTCLKIYRDNMQ